MDRPQERERERERTEVRSARFFYKRKDIIIDEGVCKEFLTIWKRGMKEV